jgi:hypothetical protein
VKLRLKLWLQRREPCGLLNWRRRSADLGDDCRAMRNHAQRTMRSRRRLTRQGIVHVYGLHEAESNHDQGESQCCPFAEQRAFELANGIHRGRRGSTIPVLDARIEPEVAGNVAFSPRQSLCRADQSVSEAVWLTAGFP